MLGGYFISGFLIRAILNAIVLFILIANLPGISVNTLGGTLLGVCAFGFINASLRPVLFLIAHNPGFLLVSVFTFIVNVLMFYLLIKILPGVKISAWGDFISLAPLLFVTLVSFILTEVIKDR